MKSLTLAGIALHSLRYFFKSHVAVGLGVAAATAVIVGALVVGDSVRGSLRSLVLDRLVNVQSLLHARTFFEPEMLASLKLPTVQAAETTSSAARGDESIVPMIYLPGSTVEHRADSQVHRGAGVQLFGVVVDYWKVLATAEQLLPPGLNEDEIAVGSSLAAELEVKVGDELTLRFHSLGGVPADNPLGNRDDASLNLPRQRIVAILPDRGLGGLSFQSTTNVPRNIFCSAASLQEILECGTKVNAALVLSPISATRPPAISPEVCQLLDEQLQPTIEDYGLKLERITRRFPDADDQQSQRSKTPAPSEATASQTIYDYYQLTSQALILDNGTSNAVVHASPGLANRLITYLGNTICKVEPLASDLMPRNSSQALNPDQSRMNLSPTDVSILSRQVPYSTVVGVEALVQERLEPFTSVAAESIRTPYCWINSWLAEQLDATPGDWIEIKYFEPETIDGVEREQSVRCMIAGIVPLTEPAQKYRRDRPASYTEPPTFFNDPNLTPTVPGLTDKESIANWDAPFKLDLDLLQSADDDYYDNHRLTPKVFLPYRFAASTRMFGSRFGQTTAIRFPAALVANEAELRSRIETALLPTRAEQRFTFVPVRQKLLQSASGTTPFDLLFLSLSFFVIAAALMLVALLFKLGIAQRANQLGLLAAHGFTPTRIRGLLLREQAVVAVAGGTMGIFLGLGYARAMLAALQSWWVGAISTPFLTFSFTWLSLLIGVAAGLLMSLATIYFSLRKLSSLAPLQLLRGQTEKVSGRVGKFHRGLLAMSGFLALGAMALIIAAIGQTGMARAGTFFGSGMLLLLAALLATHQLLRSRAKIGGADPGRSNLLKLAWSTIHRNPLRSSLALGLLAVASFLIASMSVFHVAPDPRGYGGFDLMGESSQPIYRNISSRSVQEEVLGAEAERLRDTYVLAFRMRAGEDASCNNLFQVAQPTILAVPRRLSQLNDYNGPATTFQWAATTAPQEPWKALEQAAIGDMFSPIPVILDQNTAAWSLKRGASLGAIFQLQYGPRDIYFKTVGLLSNSVLQGKLMISDSNFRFLFPELSGNSFFLIRSGGSTPASEVSGTLEQGWSDEGLDITSSVQTLASLLGVQNTYISAFQSLGALGLLLGSFGLIAVQLRSVIERRRELALMQAVGFSKSRIGWMLTLETALLLGGGLLIGCIAAAIALFPYVVENGTQLSALQPLVMLAVVLLVGFFASVVAVHAAMQRSVLDGLRGE